MKPEEPVSIIGKMVGVCFSLLLGAMAIYGAVEIIASVWLPLCMGVAAVAGLAGTWFLIRRMRGF